MLFWTSQLVFFLYTLMIAKELSAEQFGIYSLLFAFLMFGMRFNEIGIGDYFVINGRKEDLGSVFIINMLKSVILFIFFIIFSFIIPVYYRQDMLFSGLIIIAFSLLLDGIKNPYIYYMYQCNRTNVVVFIEKGSYLLGLLLGSVIFYFHRSILISLVTFLLYFILQSLMSYYFLPSYHIRFKDINYEYLKKTLNFAKQVIAFLIITYALRQGIELIVPKLLSFEILGQYSFLAMLTFAPINLFVYPLNKILFPVYAKRSAEIKILTRSTLLVYLILFFVYLFTYYDLKTMLHYFSYTKYFDNNLLLLLIVYSVIRGVLANVGIYYKAINKQALYNRIVLVELVVLIGALFFLRSNIYEILYAMIIAISFHFIVAFFMLGLITIKNVLWTTLISFCMVVIYILESHMSFPFRMVINIPASVVCFFFMIKCTK